MKMSVTFAILVTAISKREKTFYLITELLMRKINIINVPFGMLSSTEPIPVKGIAKFTPQKDNLTTVKAGFPQLKK